VRSTLHRQTYLAATRALLWALRRRRCSSGLTRFAKVWLRQARLSTYLAQSSYDWIVDGGASIGEFAALVRAVRPDIPLLCIEPHPASASVLRKRGFRVVEAALWSKRGNIRLSQPSDAVTSCTVTGNADPGRPSWTVQTVRLDELPIEGQHILIKLDLQGAELQALAGMGSLWPRCAGLLLEVSYGPSGSYEPLRAWLGEKGFYEAATFNELESGGVPIEADKLWIRRNSGIG
jgi:FkbM family methyltransferase